MNFVGSFLQLNSMICLALGLIFNFLLIWLVIRKSPKEMRDYGRILLQICCTDLALLIGVFILQPIFIVYQGISICHLYGRMMADFDPFWQSVVVAAWITLYYFCCFGFSVQFLYRYLTLNKSLQISFCQYLSMSAISASICFLLSLWIFIDNLVGQASLNSTQIEELSEMLIGQTDLDIEFAWKIKHNSDGIPFFCFSMLVDIGSFLLISICGFKMLKFVRTHSMLDKERSLNKQLTNSLLIMAIFPLLICIHNVFGAIFASIFVQKNILVYLIGALPSSWMPTLNPLITILTIRPFRRTILAFLTGKKATISTVVILAAKPSTAQIY